MKFTFSNALGLTLVSISTCHAASLPLVDLGYVGHLPAPCSRRLLTRQELHQALSYNTTTDVYKFLNIRYGQPPVVNLRFRAPLPPLVDRTVIQNGSVVRTCPQGVPTWQAKAFIPFSQYISGEKPFSLKAWEKSVATASVPLLDYNAATTEDCLFLDVHVSRKAFQNAAANKTSGSGASVLVWVEEILCQTQETRVTKVINRYTAADMS
jgi:hypothetical protein